MSATQKLLQEAAWRKSSLSEGGYDCVEATLLMAIALRDSKAPEGPALVFTASEWNAFIAGVRLGEFDVERLGESAIG